MALPTISSEVTGGKEGTPVIRVLVVDDHRMFAESLVRVLDDEQDIEVTGIAVSAADATAQVAQHHPDVCVLDYQLPDQDGASAVEGLRARAPELRVVMLTGLAQSHTARAAMDAGCNAFVTKDRAAHDLVSAVRAAHAGVDLPVQSFPEPASERFGLTPREHEVLALLADGCSTEDIMGRLFVSRNTVRTHVQKVIGKLGAHSKLEAVALARREGVV
jgi:DNA-binding NarL/FixJ family response regulator